MTPKQAASIRDVARAAKVSTATVSRVLNRPDLVATGTAARVQRAIDELSYQPNAFAQGLMTRKSRLLGVALPDIHGEFYSEILRGADAEARKQGYHLLVSPGVSDSSGGLVDSPAAGLLGGLVVMVTEPNQELWKQAREASVPVVVIDRDVHEAGVDSVLIDNAKGTREAVEHLLNGAKAAQCFFVGGPRANFDTAQRSDVFARVLREHGHDVEPAQIAFREYSVEWGEEWARDRLRAARTGAIGVLAANDEIAYGIVRAAMSMGLQVGKDVRVVGFDDSRLASLVHPRLSSVCVPWAEVGAAAIATLVKRLEDPGHEAHTTPLTTVLVVRESSGG